MFVAHVAVRPSVLDTVKQNNNNSRCGGYGNRIQGITVALTFAILSNRTLLIEMKYPFNINTLLHPNVIQWNYTLTNKANSQHYILQDEHNLDRY